MRVVLLIVAVLFIVLISGCTMPGSEERRAIVLAAQTTEGQIMEKIYIASSRIQYCTMQNVIEAMSILPDAPQLTQEQMQQVDVQLEVIKKCFPRMNIQAKDMTNGIYNVEYTSFPPETCTNPQIMESFTMQSQPSLVIEADLNDNSTRVIRGEVSIDPTQIQVLFDQMEMFGDCAGLVLMSFTAFTSQTPQAVMQERQQV